MSITGVIVCVRGNGKPRKKQKVVSQQERDERTIDSRELCSRCKRPGTLNRDLLCRNCQDDMDIDF